MYTLVITNGSQQLEWLEERHELHCVLITLIKLSKTQVLMTMCRFVLLMI